MDDLLCAGEQLLAEVAWLCKLTEQAIANNEERVELSKRAWPNQCQIRVGAGCQAQRGFQASDLLV